MSTVIQFEEVLATQYSQGMACSRLGALSNQGRQGLSSSGTDEGIMCTGKVSTMGKQHTMCRGQGRTTVNITKTEGKPRVQVVRKGKVTPACTVAWPSVFYCEWRCHWG